MFGSSKVSPADGAAEYTATFPAGSLGLELQQGDQATAGKCNCWTTNVVAGGAAAAAGVAIGDAVCRVAGDDVVGLAATDVVQRIVAASRPVAIVFRRQGAAEAGSGSGGRGGTAAGPATAGGGIANRRMSAGTAADLETARKLSELNKGVHSHSAMAALRDQEEAAYAAVEASRKIARQVSHDEIAARKARQSSKHHHDAATKIQSLQRGVTGRKKSVSEKGVALSKDPQQLERVAEECEMTEEQQAAAVKIQAAQRGSSAKKKVKKKKKAKKKKAKKKKAKEQPAAGGGGGKEQKAPPPASDPVPAKAEESKAGGGNQVVVAVFPAGSLGLELQQGSNATPGKMNCWATNVVAGGAAAAAGVAIGDAVCRVAGADVVGLAATDVVQRIVVAPRPVEIVFQRKAAAGAGNAGNAGAGSASGPKSAEVRAAARADADNDGVPDDVVPPLERWVPPKESYKKYQIVPDPAWERGKNFLSQNGI